MFCFSAFNKFFFFFAFRLFTFFFTTFTATFFFKCFFISFVSCCFSSACFSASCRFTSGSPTHTYFFKHRLFIRIGWVFVHAFIRGRSIATIIWLIKLTAASWRISLWSFRCCSLFFWRRGAWFFCFFVCTFFCFFFFFSMFFSAWLIFFDERC